MGSNEFIKENSQVKESIYLYDPDQKGFYNDILVKFNQSNCIFGRNLLAYLEDEKDNGDSFYSKHLLVCEQCQGKASSYRSMKRKIEKNIPDQSIDKKLLAMLESEINEAFVNFSRDRDSSDKINWMKTLKLSLIEFSKTFFRSREFVIGLGFALLVALSISLFM